MKIKRRDFLKLSAATGLAVAAFKGSTLNALAEAPQGAIGEKPGTWMPSTCQGCTAWCPVEFFVQDGRAVKVRGNQLSKANNGYCCPRGHLMLQQAYDPDRVKVPMKRTNPAKGRGIDPKFVPISWDEALDTVADKMLELRKAGEPEKLMYMRGRFPPSQRNCSTAPCPRSTAPPTTSPTAPSAPRRRRWAPVIPRASSATAITTWPRPPVW